MIWCLYQTVSSPFLHIKRIQSPRVLWRGRKMRLHHHDMGLSSF